jgi:hypothetical protein
MIMADDHKLETIEDVLRSLVALAKDARALAASMRNVLDTKAVENKELHAFAHRIFVCLTDWGHALANTESMLPAKYRAADQGGDK